MKRAKLIAAALLILLALVWAMQNRAEVDTRFLFATVRMPQSALLVITLLVGMAIGLLGALGLRSRGRKG